MTIAILIGDDIRQDNELTRELYGTEAELAKLQLPFVSPQLYPSVVDSRIPGNSFETSLPPPQIAAPSPSTVWERELHYWHLDLPREKIVSNPIAVDVNEGDD